MRALSNQSTDSSANLDDGSRRWLTVPNALCLFRILAAPVLFLLATRGLRFELVLLFVMMAISDWLDGKLAILLDQRSRIGPTLDSIADLIMYGALFASIAALDARFLEREAPILALPVVTYLAAGLASLIKFGRWPIHHTRMAKISWLLVLLSAVVVVAGGSVWPLRVAMLSVTLANLQSLLITRLLPEWTTDVPSMARARLLRSAHLHDQSDDGQSDDGARSSDL